MDTSAHVTRIEPTKQETLEIWLKRRGSSFAALGREMGISRKSSAELFTSATAPAYRVEQMRQLRVNGESIPEDLLPEPHVWAKVPLSILPAAPEA